MGSTATGVGLILMGVFWWVCQDNLPDGNDLAHRVRQVVKVGALALVIAGAALAVGVLTT